MLGRPGNMLMGPAYMMALTDHLPEPKNAAYPNEEPRQAWEQTLFRNCLIKAYHIHGDEIVRSKPLEFCKHLPWCPVSSTNWPQPCVKAAHIVPYALREATVAYLFGEPIEQGYQIIWSVKSGMMLQEAIEAAFDDGQLLIIPDPADKGGKEFISIILDEGLFGKLCPATGIDWHGLYKKKALTSRLKPAPQNDTSICTLLSLFFDAVGTPYRIGKQIPKRFLLDAPGLPRANGFGGVL